MSNECLLSVKLVYQESTALFQFIYRKPVIEH